MLFFVLLFLAIIGIVIICLCDDLGYFFGAIFIIVGGLGTIISLFGFTNYIGIEGHVASHYQRYEILTYQVETKMYDNDNEYGKQELMQKVQDWNEDLACVKANQDNFWIGIYIPNIYDQFEYIDYTAMK